MDNYGNKFSVLLFLEEIQRERDIRQFDMAMVSFSLMKSCDYYEKKSLLGGDEEVWSLPEPGSPWIGRGEAIPLDGG